MKRNVWVGFVAPWIGFTLLWADFGMDFGAPSYLRRLGYGLVIGFMSCGMTYAIKSLALNPVLNWMAKQQRRPSSPPDALTNSPRSEQTQTEVRRGRLGNRE